MASPNVESVRRFYAGINSGDLEAAVADCAEDVRYVNPEYAAEPGVREGIAGLRKAFAGLTIAFADYRCDVREIWEGEDVVVVAEESSGRGRGSGAEFRALHGHAFLFRDGRLVEFRWYRTPEEALDAAGLSR